MSVFGSPDCTGRTVPRARSADRQGSRLGLERATAPRGRDIPLAAKENRANQLGRTRTVADDERLGPRDDLAGRRPPVAASGARRNRASAIASEAPHAVRSVRRRLGDLSSPVRMEGLSPCCRWRGPLPLGPGGDSRAGHLGAPRQRVEASGSSGEHAALLRPIPPRLAEHLDLPIPTRRAAIRRREGRARDRPSGAGPRLEGGTLDLLGDHQELLPVEGRGPAIASCKAKDHRGLPSSSPLKTGRCAEPLHS